MSPIRDVPLRQFLKPRNDIVHPRDRPSGQSIFVGLEHIEPHTGRRIGGLDVSLERLTGRKARFFPGDIVYGYLRPYLNKVWLADCHGLCSVDQYVFRVDESADAGYVAAFMRSPLFLERAPIGETPGQLPRIRLDEVLEVPMPTASLTEQRRVAAIIRDQLSAVEALSEAIEAQHDVAAALPAAILRRAFTTFDQ